MQGTRVLAQTVSLGALVLLASVMWLCNSTALGHQTKLVSFSPPVGFTEPREAIQCLRLHSGRGKGSFFRDFETTLFVGKTGGVTKKLFDPPHPWEPSFSGDIGKRYRWVHNQEEWGM